MKKVLGISNCSNSFVINSIELIFLSAISDPFCDVIKEPRGLSQSNPNIILTLGSVFAPKNFGGSGE